MSNWRRCVIWVGRILPRFRDITGFCWKQRPHSVFHPNFGVFPWTRSPILGLWGKWGAKTVTLNFIRVFTLEVTQPKIYDPKSPKSQTDGRTTYDSNAAHVYRGNNWLGCTGLQVEVIMIIIIIIIISIIIYFAQYTKWTSRGASVVRGTTNPAPCCHRMIMTC